MIITSRTHVVDATVLKGVYSFLLLKDPRNSQIKLGKDNKVPNEKITVEKKSLDLLLH